MFINENSIVVLMVSGGTTVFPFGFKWYNESDINVYHTNVGVDSTDEDLLSSIDYTITSNASKVGGEVEILIPLSEGDTITISRLLPVTREIEYTTRGSFTASVVNNDQDYQSYLLLDLSSYSNLFIRLPVSGGDYDSPLEFPVFKANAYIRYDDVGNLVTDADIPDIVGEAQREAWISQAEALTSESFAIQPEDIEVNRYVSNGDGSFTSTPITDTFSALHWANKAELSTLGLTFQGTWDASTNVYPTTRPPEGTGDPLESGDVFFVNVGGTILGTDWFIRDWMIRNTTNDGWVRLPQIVDWDAIINIPDNVTNAVNSTGDTMSGDLTLVNDVALKGTKGDTSIVDLLRLKAGNEFTIGDTSLFTGIKGICIFEQIPNCNIAPLGDFNLTNKLYVDEALDTKVNNNDGFNAVTAMTSLTQAEYDGITPNTNTLYVIVG